MLRIVERTGNPMLEIPLPGLFACPGIRARSLRDRPRRFAFRTSDIEPATPLDVAGGAGTSSRGPEGSGLGGK